MLENFLESFRSRRCIRWLIPFCVANQLLYLLLSPRFVSQYYALPIPQPLETDDLPFKSSGFHFSFQSILPFALQQGDIKQKRQQLRYATNTWHSKVRDPSQDRCALCFFGLPRSFDTIVLPSIVKNLLIPNARHNCDIYMHFYEIYEESVGRQNQGGKLDPSKVYLLEQAVQNVQAKRHQHHDGQPFSKTGRIHRPPIVSFTNDTDAVFWKKRGAIIAKYQNTTNPKTGRPLYFPYKEITYVRSSVDNIVRQWHSIESVFRLMESTGQQMQVNYSRVGMFRSDVMYMTPIDIALLDRGLIDSQNRHVVVPGFGSWPVNDRMIYGSFEGVKVWSTRRFSLIEERASARRNAGYVMHSERFLAYTVFPAIRASGYKVNTNWDICMIRTRAHAMALISDCSIGGTSRGWNKVDGRALVESIIQKNCSSPFNPNSIPTKKPFYIYVGCEDGIHYSKRPVRSICSNPRSDVNSTL